MKTVLVRVLLVAYCILVAKPALPFAADFAAHMFWTEHHYEHHHHDHGHDHVHKEVKKAADDDKTPEKKSAFEKETMWVHINPEFDHEIKFIACMIPQHNSVFNAHFSCQGIGVLTPPPRV